MQVPASSLPDSAPILQHALDQALNIVNDDLGASPSQQTSWSVYELATYNLGGHFLIEFAPDVSYPLTAASWAAGMATIQTTDPSLIQPGDKLKITGVSPLGYSGSSKDGYITAVATPDTTHFSYPITNPGAATVLPGAAATEQFWALARKQLKITSFTPGVVSSASDAGTSVGLQTFDFFRGLTLMDLQLLKTSYGRAYLAIAQQYGPTAWGVT